MRINKGNNNKAVPKNNFLISLNITEKKVKSEQQLDIENLQRFMKDNFLPIENLKMLNIT